MRRCRRRSLDTRIRHGAAVPYAIAATMEKTVRLNYDCSKCPAYCCSYDRIIVTAYDLKRLARHFDVTPAEAEKRYTKVVEGERVLRHRKDHIYNSVCMFLDQETRRCTIYEARPAVCREYPEVNRCGYYEFLRWEREHQEDETFIPSA